MTRMRLFLATLAVVCLIPAVARAALPYGTPFTLGVGASSAVGDEGLVLGFEGVLADSRCPTGVWCFWPGDAAAALWLEIPDCPRQDFVLHTYYWGDRHRDIFIAPERAAAISSRSFCHSPISPNPEVITTATAG